MPWAVLTHAGCAGVAVAVAACWADSAEATVPTPNRARATISSVTSPPDPRRTAGIVRFNTDTSDLRWNHSWLTCEFRVSRFPHRERARDPCDAPNKSSPRSIWLDVFQ